MSENKQNIISQLRQTCTGVYCGTRQLPIKEQRGKRYVNYKGHQINLKDIPEGFAPEEDEVFRYIFCYGFRDNPNPELDRLAKERIYGKPQKTQMRTITVKLKTGESQIFEIEKTEDIKEWLQANNINYSYFKY